MATFELDRRSAGTPSTSPAGWRWSPEAARGIGRAIAEAFLARRRRRGGLRSEPPSTTEDLPAADARDGERRRAVFVAADLREAEQAASRHRRRRRPVRPPRRPGQQRRRLTRRPTRRPLSPRFSPRSWRSTCSPPCTAPRRRTPSCSARPRAGPSSTSDRSAGCGPRRGRPPTARRRPGLVSLTQTLAVEWAPKVRVNCVSAGLVATEAAEDHYGGPEGMAEVAAHRAPRPVRHARRTSPGCASSWPRRWPGT